MTGSFTPFLKTYGFDFSNEPLEDIEFHYEDD
jgi:hypothetical protein